MKSFLHLPDRSLLVAAVLALAPPGAARAEENLTTIKGSDPAKPCTLKIVVGRGDVRLTGADTAEIAVKSEAQAVTAKPRKDGLRVISASTSFTLTEKDNVVTLNATDDGWAGAPSDFRVTVPRNTNIVVASSFGGDIACTGVTGDLEVKNMSGEIRLDDVTGGALVETMNGEIRASIRELRDGKPLSFTSMNGEVILRVPADTKANVRLRTQNGSILTDFDEKSLVTKTEATPRAPSRKSTRKFDSAGAPPAVSPGDVAPQPAPAPMPPDAPNSGLDRNDREEIRTAVRDSVQTAMAIARDALQAAHEGMAEAGIAMKIPSIPTLTGGKLVTGTLNGGGPEISVTTMNGDVTLRQLEAKK